MLQIPTIAIVGRPNVGKSTLFNRIVEDRISIVEDKEGVTRDRIYASGEWLTNEFNLIDTGGITTENEPLWQQVRNQAEVAVDEADVILFVVSVTEGITDLDQEVANLLHRSGKPIVLAVNKVDNPERRADIYQFYSLGVGDPIPVSGTHGVGLGDVLDQAVAHFQNQAAIDQEDDVIRFSLIGRPNVGKSSLVNAIIGEDRAIVSDIPGTTRDATDTKFVDEDGQEYIIIDTAGIRKRGKVYENTEKYSVMRSMRAIERSNVVLLVLNAEEGIREQDKRVAGYAHEAGKGLIILVNKWDTIKKDNQTMKNFENDIRNEFAYLSYAPILFTSAVSKVRLGQIFDLVKEVYENQRLRVQSSVLNQVIEQAVLMTPPPTDKGRRLRIYYATQVSVEPPTFVIFVNDLDLMHFSYKRYLENQLRENFNFDGTPIHLIIRERS